MFCKQFHIYFCPQTLITQARTKQAATMSEVEWRGRTVPVKIDKARIFLLGQADNEAAIAQVESSCFVGIIKPHPQCDGIVSNVICHNMPALVHIHIHVRVSKSFHSTKMLSRHISCLSTVYMTK